MLIDRRDLERLSSESRQELVSMWIDRAIRDRVPDVLALSGLESEADQLGRFAPFSPETATQAQATLKKMAGDIMLRQLDWRREHGDLEEGPFMKPASALFALAAAIKNHASAMSVDDAYMGAVACGTIAVFARKGREESQLQRDEVRNRSSG